MTAYSFSRDSFEQQVLCKIRKQDNANNTSHVPYLFHASDMCAYDHAPPDQSANCLSIDYGAVETKVGGTTLSKEEIRRANPLYTVKADDGVDVFLTYDGDEYYDIPQSNTQLWPLTDYQHGGGSAVGGFTAGFAAPSDEAVDRYAEELRRLMGCNEEGGGLQADAGCEGLTAEAAVAKDDKDDCYAEELEELLLGDDERGSDGSVDKDSSDDEDGCYPEQLERLLLAAGDE